MLKIKANQISLNDIIYDTGDIYSSHHEVTKIIVRSINFREFDEDNVIVINDTYWLYKCKDEECYYNNRLTFSENKANRIVDEYIKQQQKRKEKYEKEKVIKEQYDKQIIDNKLREKYIDKPIMINRHNEWEKTKVKEIYATNKGIYLRPYLDGHLCKLSREGKTWKMWSELEELEIQKQKLEKRINELKSVED